MSTFSSSSSTVGSLPRRPAPPVPVRATVNAVANGGNIVNRQQATSTSTSSASPSPSSSSGVSDGSSGSAAVSSSSVVSSSTGSTGGSTLDVQQQNSSTSSASDYDHLSDRKRLLKKAIAYAGATSSGDPLLAPDYTNLIAMAEGGGGGGDNAGTVSCFFLFLLFCFLFEGFKSR